MATQHEIDQWFSAIGTAGNYRTMHYFDGNGDINRVFEINFEGGYINRADVKAFMTQDQTRETQVLSPIFQGPNSIRFNVAVPVGWTVLIYRDTPKAQPLSQFVDGAIINANNLDRNAKQAVFAVSEMVDRFDSTVEQVNTALEQVYQANLKADEAIRTANAADAKANQAIQTANAADGKADQAINTANSATQTANGAVQTANGAVQTANEAKQIAEGIDGKVNQANQTAGEAKQIAEGIDDKATKALNDSATAVQTANQATQTANGVDGKATKALADSAEALRKSNEAIEAGGIGAELVRRVASMPAGNDEVYWKNKQSAPTFAGNQLQLHAWETGTGQIPAHFERNVWRPTGEGVNGALREDTHVRSGNKFRTVRTRYVPDSSKWPAGGGNANGIAWEDNFIDVNNYGVTNFHGDALAKKGFAFEGVPEFKNFSDFRKYARFHSENDAIVLEGKSSTGQYIAAYRDGQSSWRIGRPDAGVNSEWRNYLTNTVLTLTESGPVSNKIVRSDAGFSVSGSTGSYVKTGFGGSWNDWTGSQMPGLQVDIKQDNSAYLVWRATHWGASHVAACQVLSNQDGSYRVIRNTIGSAYYEKASNGNFAMVNGPGGRSWNISNEGDISGSAYGGWLTTWVNKRLNDHTSWYAYSKAQSDERYMYKWDAPKTYDRNVGEVGQHFIGICQTMDTWINGVYYFPADNRHRLYVTSITGGNMQEVTAGNYKRLSTGDGRGASLWVRVS